jgi:hypothetical protein
VSTRLRSAANPGSCSCAVVCTMAIDRGPGRGGGGVSVAARTAPRGRGNPDGLVAPRARRLPHQRVNPGRLVTTAGQPAPAGLSGLGGAGRSRRVRPPSAAALGRWVAAWGGGRPNGWVEASRGLERDHMVSEWSLRVYCRFALSPDAGLTGPCRAVTLVADAYLPCRTRCDCPCGATTFGAVQHARPRCGAARGAGDASPVRRSPDPRVRADPGRRLRPRPAPGHPGPAQQDRHGGRHQASLTVAFGS